MESIKGMNMARIKVLFLGFWKDFDPNDNFILDILRERYDVELSTNPDFLFYSTFSADHLYYTDCVKIFYTNEAITPDFNECDYAVGFDYMSFEQRYMRMDRSVPYDAEQKKALPQSMAQRKFCNFIYFNKDSGHGTRLRQDFCQELMQYRQVDCPGRVMNNMQDAISPRFERWEEGKLAFIKEYKFTIAFENCSKAGYVTEKILHPFMAHSVPIYWGDPLIAREFNSKAFVNAHDFASTSELIDYIRYLDTHDEAYMSMLREPPMREDYVYEPHKLHEFIYAIVEKGNNPLPKDPRNNWDTKKEIIKKLLQEACYFHAESHNVSKVEEYTGLALCLDANLTWPHKQLATAYKGTSCGPHTLPEWHQEKLLSHMTLSKMLAEGLVQNGDTQACKRVLEKVIQRQPRAVWAQEMLRSMT